MEHFEANGTNSSSKCSSTCTANSKPAATSDTGVINFSFLSLNLIFDSVLNSLSTKKVRKKMNSELAEKSDLKMDPTMASTAAKPTVYIVVQGSVLTPDDQHFKKTFPKKAVLVLSSLQLVACAIAVFCQVIKKY